MADFYGNAVGFSDYLTARGRPVPAGNDAAKEAALLVASEWIDRVYGMLFSGTKTSLRMQLRAWPRNGAWESVDLSTFPNDVIPVEVVQATYEAAQRQMVSPGSLAIDYTPGKYESVSISGAIAVKYAKFNSAYDIQTHFTMIDQIISPLLTANGGGASNPLTGSLSRV